jgi:hypothetical protein
MAQTRILSPRGDGLGLIASTVPIPWNDVKV